VHRPDRFAVWTEVDDPTDEALARIRHSREVFHKACALGLTPVAMPKFKTSDQHSDPWRTSTVVLTEIPVVAVNAP
jgi:hypothetical protein